MMNNDLKWKMRYIQLAADISSWSKDPNAKVGAVVVGSKGQVLSQGYNGFPRGVNDHVERYNDRKEKHKYVVHAEMNAIYNASYTGVSLDGATIYVYGLPVCNECAKGIIQVGIKSVVVATPEWLEVNTKWVDSWLCTISMFDEAGVGYEWIRV
jgi:dCMP deaminase